VVTDARRLLEGGEPVIFIFNAVVYLALNIFLLGMGIGLGFLLHWLFPGVDIGMGILIGVLATTAAVHFHTRVLNALDEYQLDVDEDETTDESNYSRNYSKPPDRKKRKK